MLSLGVPAVLLVLEADHLRELDKAVVFLVQHEQASDQVLVYFVSEE